MKFFFFFFTFGSTPQTSGLIREKATHTVVSCDTEKALGESVQGTVQGQVPGSKLVEEGETLYREPGKLW